ncbi:alpha/beta fold hydrolase [Hydrogenophaga sp. XSHU_21]
MTHPALPPGLPVAPRLLDTRAGRVAVFEAGQGTALPPLVLLHSVNAAASVAEVAPLFERLQADRRVVAFDLPGYGHSDRSDRPYTPRLMTDALHAVIDEVCRQTGAPWVDVLAVSLSGEFAARAAVERPDRIRRLALVSPTGFSRRKRRHGPPGTTLLVPWLYRWLRRPGWGEAVFRQLTRPGVIRYFLKRTFGRPQIDEALWRHAVVTTRQPGAHHAPLCFVSAGLFSGDVNTLYESLTQPVWVSMATRGDFTDYQGRVTVDARPNWRFEAVDGGALPYFEDLGAFVARLEPFWR